MRGRRRCSASIGSGPPPDRIRASAPSVVTRLSMHADHSADQRFGAAPTAAPRHGACAPSQFRGHAIMSVFTSRSRGGLKGSRHGFTLISAAHYECVCERLNIYAEGSGSAKDSGVYRPPKSPPSPNLPRSSAEPAHGDALAHHRAHRCHRAGGPRDRGAAGQRGPRDREGRGTERAAGQAPPPTIANPSPLAGASRG